MDDRSAIWPMKDPDIGGLPFSRSALCEALVTKRCLLARQAKRHRLPDLAWTMLFELYLAKVRYMKISISGLGYAAHILPSTATRIIQKMEKQGLIERIEDRADRRRTFMVIGPYGEQLVDLALKAFEKTLSDRIVREQAVSNQWRRALGVGRTLSRLPKRPEPLR
jgi:DNA-binding MarR family transcriptional regulator